MGMQYSASEIAQILPHRYPFALVDRVLDGEPGHWARAVKCVTINEPFFQGHFPGTPVMPGVLIIEAMAQVGGVALLSLPENRGKLAFLGRVRDARFLRKVPPGDVLGMECVITRQRGPVGVGECRATVDGETVATAQLTFSLG